MINLVIEDCRGEIFFREGCLGLPKIYDEVTRYHSCRVEYQDAKGQKHTLQVEDLFSICVQHKNGHLNGIVFLERLSSLKKELYIKKMLKRCKRDFVERPQHD